MAGKQIFKQQILELRKKGFTYKKIQETLGCNKSTVSYHCNKNRQEKMRQYQRKYNKTNYKANAHKTLYRKIRIFHRTLTTRTHCFSVPLSFSSDDLIQKFGQHPKCALTGVDIDLSEAQTYSLDHIIPKSKGGLCSIDNCQIVCSAANKAKHDLNMEEFVQLCKSVVAHMDSK
jgi:5-methylcytosine-specific restriction endonuclease McrA